MQSAGIQSICAAVKIANLTDTANVHRTTASTWLAQGQSILGQHLGVCWGAVGFKFRRENCSEIHNITYHMTHWNHIVVLVTKTSSKTLPYPQYLWISVKSENSIPSPKDRRMDRHCKHFAMQTSRLFTLGTNVRIVQIICTQMKGFSNQFTGNCASRLCSSRTNHKLDEVFTTARGVWI